MSVALNWVVRVSADSAANE